MTTDFRIASFSLCVRGAVKSAHCHLVFLWGRIPNIAARGKSPGQAKACPTYIRKCLIENVGHALACPRRHAHRLLPRADREHQVTFVTSACDTIDHDARSTGAVSTRGLKFSLQKASECRPRR